MKCAGETFISAFDIRRHYKDTFKMIRSTKMNLFYFLFFLNFDPCYSACARAEYETHGECCPMCAPGNRVYRDCTEFTSTTCVPCMGATFLDAPNGLKECFNCMICDPGFGLRVKTACTRTSDTVCEPLQGYYCKDENRGSCIYALTHTKCQPGHYIKQIGTADKDAVCAKCADGTFSNGTLQTCQPHSKCEDLGLALEKAGTAESDTECGKRAPVGLILGILCGILVAIITPAGFIFYKKKLKGHFRESCTAMIGHRHPQQESSPVDACIRKPAVSDSSCNPGPDMPLREPQETSEDELTDPQTLSSGKSRTYNLDQDLDSYRTLD